jgi:hypothetical protein
MTFARAVESGQRFFVPSRLQKRRPEALVVVPAPGQPGPPFSRLDGAALEGDLLLDVVGDGRENAEPLVVFRVPFEHGAGERPGFGLAPQLNQIPRAVVMGVTPVREALRDGVPSAFRVLGAPRVLQSRRVVVVRGLELRTDHGARGQDALALFDRPGAERQRAQRIAEVLVLGMAPDHPAQQRDRLLAPTLVGELVGDLTHQSRRQPLDPALVEELDETGGVPLLRPAPLGVRCIDAQRHLEQLRGLRLHAVGRPLVQPVGHPGRELRAMRKFRQRVEAPLARAEVLGDDLRAFRVDAHDPFVLRKLEDLLDLGEDHGELRGDALLLVLLLLRLLQSLQRSAGVARAALVGLGHRDRRLRRRDRRHQVAVALEPRGLVQRRRHAALRLGVLGFPRAAPPEIPAAAHEDGDERNRGEDHRAPARRERALRRRLRLDGGELRLAHALLDRGEVVGEASRDDGGVRGTVVAEGLEAVARQLLDLLGRVARVEPRVRVVEPALRGGQQLVARAAGIRRLTGEDLAQDRTEREDVAALVELVDVAQGLLGRHVGGRPHDAARDRLRALRLAAHGRDDGMLLPFLRALLQAEHLREAPVDDDDLAERPDHHVGGLEVAVDHAAAVGVRHRERELLEDRERVVAVRVGVHERRQRAPLDELHREVRAAVGLQAHAVDGHDAGVLELAADLRLLDEALDDVGALRVLGAQHLERDVAVEVLVAAAVDEADAAARDLAEDLVARVVDRGRVVAAERDRRGAVVHLAQGDVAARAVEPLDGGQHALARGLGVLLVARFEPGIQRIVAHLAWIPGAPRFLKR